MGGVGGKRKRRRVLDGRREDGKGVVGAERGRESLFPSIFTAGELLNWELELERVP